MSFKEGEIKGVAHKATMRQIFSKNFLILVPLKCSFMYPGLCAKKVLKKRIFHTKCSFCFKKGAFLKAVSFIFNRFFEYSHKGRLLHDLDLR
jgi:hypothetical protein